MAAFYRQFGWPEAPTSVPEHVVFQCTNGVVLGLFSETMYESRFGVAGTAFRGFTLTIHCEDAGAVFRAHDQVSQLDDISDLDETVAKSGWGCGFSFRDPEGTLGTSPSSMARSSTTAAASSTPEPDACGNDAGRQGSV